MVQGETRGERADRTRRAIGRRVAGTAALLASFVGAAEMSAQGVVRAADVRVASDAERYLRALSALVPVDSAPSWSVRPLDVALGRRALRALATAPGPWTLETAPLPDGLRWRSADVVATLNSGLPSDEPDGPAWAGRGVSTRVSALVEARYGRLHVRLAPMAWWAQNASFALAPTAGLFPWSDPATPMSIDAPQRFGDAAVARLDPGESSVEVRWEHARLALTSAAAQLGPGTDHSLLLQSGAGGLPRLEFGLPGGVDTRIGRLGLQLAWGRTPHTAWAPDRRTGALFTSFLVGSWQPAFVPQLEVGLARLNHRDWERISARELLVPFGSVYAADWVGGSYDTEKDNQIASVFARLRVPAGGLELFAEYGKNDRSIDWRDQTIEPEHNAAWLIGLQKVWRAPRGRLWALNATAVNGAISPITRFRGQAYFYEHGILTQGHTLRGQLLGTPLLQREGGAEVRLDRYDARGRTGITVRTRAIPNQLADAVAPQNLRQEWSATYDVMRWTRAGAWTGRLGGVADIGHAPATGDAYSLHLSLGFSRRR